MISRFATFALFSLLACLTSVAFGQTGYYPTTAYQPVPVAYPQTNSAMGWNAGSPTGFSNFPRRLPSAHLPAPALAGYAQVTQAPANPGYFQPAVGQPGAPQHWAQHWAPQHWAPQPQATSYWTEVDPPTLPPAAGPFAPTATSPNLYHFPVSGVYRGPAALPAATAHVRPEGSVLSPTPPMYGQGMALPPGNSVMPGGSMMPGNSMMPAAGGGQGATATPGMYGVEGMVASGSAMGIGYGNAGFGYGAVGCCSPWFVGFGGLAMSRDNENNYLFSYDIADESIQLTNARNANFDWAGGMEVNFGRMFNCGHNAVEAVYWGLFPSDGATITTAADTVGGLNGILNWDQLDYGLDALLLPRTADTFVNNATMHMVQRKSEIHNIEVNLLTFLGVCGSAGGSCGKAGCGNCGGAAACGVSSQGGCGGCAACGGSNGISTWGGVGHGVCGSRWSHEWLVGVRYFSFRDNMLFGAEETGGNGVFAFEDDEIYYNIDISNNLVGAQLGFSGAYAATCHCSLDYGLKFGLFGNQVDHTSEIGGSQGIATINNGPNANVDFFVENRKTDVAFLGEANLGVSWRFGNCWSAKIGYRAVAVTGVALPTNQIYHDLRGIQDVRWVESNGSLILHGGYAGAEYRF